jgi:hypothetical protein
VGQGIATLWEAPGGGEGGSHGGAS